MSQSALFQDVPPWTKSALVSPCGRFRYILTRSWNGAQANEYVRFSTFVMLNPSTADGVDDDPTIRKCIAFARAWGKDGIVVVNLYAFRATNPKELKAAGYPVGPLNYQWHDLVFKMGNPNVICAWGANAQPDHAAEVLARIRQAGAIPYALKLNNDGSPAHPLSRGKGFIPLDATPFPFSEAA